MGRYNEARLLYTSPLFGSQANPLAERRTIHLGMDFFAASGTAIHAPLDGTVHVLANNDAPLDYGPLVILKHDEDDRRTIFHFVWPSRYGNVGAPENRPARHARTKSLRASARPRKMAVGHRICIFRSFWIFWISTQIFPAWPLPRSERFGPVFHLIQICSSAFPKNAFLPKIPSPQQTLVARRSRLGRNLSLSYQQPLKIVRGWMQYLYDETGRAFLDFYNNVPLVGHSHPRVVQAAQEQLALLNTNTRYLHDAINRYAQRLTALLPEPLNVCFFVNSGSEANELALRLARAYTGREDVIVLEHAYHGNTSTLIDISPYKFDGPGGRGRKPWVHVAPLPDDYRGKYRRDDARAGEKYAAHIGEILGDLRARSSGPCAFIAETLPSVAGQIVFPSGYLADAYARVRAAGGVCIADEVQTGFGRLGTHFWGFETQNVVPDIVVLGKPIGNGFPLGAVITTSEIARSFDNGMEFFSTFGGNPVACAAGLAVLDVLESEHLQEQARRVGDYLKKRLLALKQKYPLIGDVRGSGLFLGLDLVLDPVTRAPARRQAEYVVNRLRECGILTGTDGPHHNVIKLRPPLIITESDADIFTDALTNILAEDSAQPGPSAA